MNRSKLVLHVALVLALLGGCASAPPDLGGTTIEAEFIDSVTGERLAAMVERKKGSSTNLKGGFTELGHAKTAFSEWAVELKQALKTHP